MYAH
jgi:hypothetical protein